MPTIIEATNALAHDYADALQTARNFHDPDMTEQGNEKNRLERITKANEAALARAAQLTDRAANAVQVALNIAKRPSVNHADPASIALGESKWRQVRDLLDAGRPLAEIIDTAGPEMLATINEHGPTYLATRAQMEGRSAHEEAKMVEALQVATDTRAGVIGTGKNMQALGDARAEQAYANTITKWIEREARDPHASGLAVGTVVSSKIDEAVYRAKATRSIPNTGVLGATEAQDKENMRRVVERVRATD
ncbi:MAG: hypothetical protein ACTIJJ_05685 [Galactobacter sp.]